MAERIAAPAKAPETKQTCSNSSKQKPSFSSLEPSVEMVLQLQRTAGNQAVQRLIKSGALQEKPNNNHSGNIREQRAYHILSQGMNVSQLEMKKQLKEYKNEEEAKEVKTIDSTGKSFDVVRDSKLQIRHLKEANQEPHPQANTPVEPVFDSKISNVKALAYSKMPGLTLHLNDATISGNKGISLNHAREQPKIPSGHQPLAHKSVNDSKSQSTLPLKDSLQSSSGGSLINGSLKDGKENVLITGREAVYKTEKPAAKIVPETKAAPQIPSEIKKLPETVDKTSQKAGTLPTGLRTKTKPGAITKETEVTTKLPDGGWGLEKAADSGDLAGNKVSASSKDDPAFQEVVMEVKGVAVSEKTHAPAGIKSAEAQAAAVSPSNEISSKAAAAQVQEMDQTTPKPFDREGFKAALIKKIESITPKNLEEADGLKESGKVKSVKGDLMTQVTQNKEQSQGEIKEKAGEAPDKSGIEPKTVIPLPPTEAGPSPKGINAAQAAPKPRSESEISLQEGNKELEQEMESASITDEMLEKSNEPSFVSAVNAKKAAQANAAEAPQVYHNEEKVTLSKSQSEMVSVSQTQIEAMHSSRQKQLTQVSMQQVNSKGKDEKKRGEIANHIQEIYNRTKEKVEVCLNKLDKDVDNLFEQGSTEAQKTFEDYIDNRMKRYKEERYSDPVGLVLWAKDKLLGLPDEVNVFYEEGRKLYLKMMDTVLDRIAETVEIGLTAAKSEISNGKKEIQNYVDSLPASLKSVGQEAAKEIQNKFDNLEQSVNEKQNQLIDSLAQKYSDKVQQLDTRIQEMKAKNHGLVDVAMGALKGVIDTIKNLKDMLSSLLARVKDAVSLIISDPIRFLGNLIAGVKLGFQNFIGKIDKYLLEGLMGWLFGALAEAGIQMPESFDMKGILSLVMQVLGLTYQNIRSRAVKIVGEKVVSTIERTAGIFKNLITNGPAAIWEDIKEKLGDLKSMILEPIKDFVINRVIMAGVTWIIGLLNPASAFVKAAKAIYDIIMFFVERGSQILSLVNAIVDSITSIAMGNTTVAAVKVEQSLGKSIPVVIGFLASLLGLGGISEKIKSVIKKIQNPIEKAIDWVINLAVKGVKAAGKLVGGLFGKKDKGTKDEKLGEQDPAKAAKIDAGLAAINAEEKKYLADGKITREQAEAVASNVRKQHPVFTSLVVIDGGKTWDYKYTASPPETVKGEEKEEKASDKPENYEEIVKLKLVGSPVKDFRPPPPEGYAKYQREDKWFIRRLDADDKKYQRLGVDPGQKIVLGEGISPSEALRSEAEMRAHLGKTQLGKERHHLIPLSVAASHLLVQKAMEKGKPPYPPNSGLIYLPTDEEAAKQGEMKGLPVHSGSHPIWSGYVRDLLTDAEVQLKKAFGSLDEVPPADLTAAVVKIRSRLSKEIYSWKKME